MTPANFLVELALFAAAHVRSPRQDSRDRADFWWILGAAILAGVIVGVATKLIAFSPT